MKRFCLLVLFVLLALLLAGCIPLITANNNTSFPVRVVISSGGTSQVLSPSPGYSSTAEVGNGAWRATVIPDQEWVEYAKNMRAYLNERIANSENLTGPELLETIQKLKEIAAQMQAFEQAATGQGASCGGNIDDENAAGVIEISQGPDGALVVVCK